MKQLIAKRSILYQNRMYAPGEALPAADGRMAEAWLRAGSAAWQEDPPPAEGEKMLTGHLDPAQLAGMTKAELTGLAGELGLDVSAAKTKAAQEVQIVLVVALYDDRPDRQGYRDVLHIIQEITARYCKNPVIRIRPGSAGARGGPYTVKKPIQWAIWNDTKAHPYYLGAVEFQLEIPTICPEVPFT